MVRLALGSAKRLMVSPTGGATSPAGHHRHLNIALCQLFIGKFLVAQVFSVTNDR